MRKTLVVVESPAKAKTIKKYLGPRFDVVASKGHIKDLPKKLGIDIEKGFQETYEVVPGKEKVLQELKQAAKDVDEVLLATDPDREGEAIAWHIAEELKQAKKTTKRVEFHEITKKGVEYGVSHPRELDKDLYDAQRARRVLDRIVGYDVSALVWSKLAFGLSAGRVQSVALRLIVDREREIEAFVPEEYWNCGAALARHATAAADRPSFIGAPRVARRREARASRTATRPRRCAPTSSARAIASRRSRRASASATRPRRTRRASCSRTPSTASASAPSARCRSRRDSTRASTSASDGGSVGLITYMRTDSTRLSPDAVNAARELHRGEVRQGVGARRSRTSSSRRRTRRTRTRPSGRRRSTCTPESVRKHLKDEQFKLYKLIWERFVASQMTPAVYDQTSVDIEADAANGDEHDVRPARERAHPQVQRLARGLRQGRAARSARSPARATSEETATPAEGAAPRRAEGRKAPRTPGRGRRGDAPGARRGAGAAPA